MDNNENKGDNVLAASSFAINLTQNTEDQLNDIKTKIFDLSESKNEETIPDSQFKAITKNVVNEGTENKNTFDFEENTSYESGANPNISVIQENELVENNVQNKATQKVNETAVEKSKNLSNVQIKTEQKEVTVLTSKKNPVERDIKPKFITKSSLCLIAQYNSDTDSEINEENSNEDEVTEVPVESNNDYRNNVVEIKSESESESSSSDSDIEYLAVIKKEIEKSMDLEDDDEDDMDDDDETADKQRKKKKQNSMRVKGELQLEDLPPIEDLHITVPEEECIVLGKVHSIVDQLLLVSALPDSSLYDLDTVLFLDKGKKVLGEIFDVLGQVADPLYCVRFNTNKEIEEKGIKVGDTVYVAPKTEHAQFVILSSLMKIRGSDASWENDIEPPPRYLDYSDDEQEREARQRLRNKDRLVNKDYGDHQDPTKRLRNEVDDNDDTASNVSSSSFVSQRSNFGSRGGRPNRGRGRRAAQPHISNTEQHYQRMPNSGSWHSNYPRQCYNRPPIMPRPMYMQSPMPIPFQCFPPYVNYPTPPPMQSPSTTYLPNPYAMRPPTFSMQGVTPLTYNPNSDSQAPPPPGLE